MKPLFSFLAITAIFLSLNFVFTGCQQEEIVSPDQNDLIDERTTTTIGTPNVLFYGLGTFNMLHTYRSGPPVSELGSVFIRGLKEGELMIAIDIRPATGVLYGVTNMSEIYTVNPSSGVATLVSQSPFTPAIEGSTVSFDFNPMLDRIQLITDKGQNMMISPVSGQVIHVGFPMNNPSVELNSSAFSNNYSGTYGTVLYSIDAKGDNLFRQNPVNGSLSLVGSTGLDITGEGGFDISRSGVALGLFYASGLNTFSTGSIEDSQEAYRLYSINLRTGKSTSLGKVKPMIGIAIL